MPPRDPTAIQLDFPLLVADLIDELRLTGQLGLLNFLPEVRPTFIVGSRAGALTLTSDAITYAPAEIFDAQVTNPGANAIIIDTGALPAGDYDVQAFMSYSYSVSGTDGFLKFEHRNAANSASLSTWRLPNPTRDNDMSMSFALTLALNERLRVLNETAATGKGAGTIMAKRRVVP